MTARGTGGKGGANMQLNWAPLPWDCAGKGWREACRGRLRHFCPPRHPCRGMLIDTLPAAAPPAAVPGRPSSFAIEVPDAPPGRARAGARAAFAQVYRRLQPPRFPLALRISRPRDAAAGWTTGTLPQDGLAACRSSG